MTVTYNIDDRFCPCGERWIFVPSTYVFRDYYYCKHCDKIFTPTVEEKTKEWFDENYSSNKLGKIKRLALILEAREKVKEKDAINKKRGSICGSIKK